MFSNKDLLILASTISNDKYKNSVYKLTKMMVWGSKNTILGVDLEHRKCVLLSVENLEISKFSFYAQEEKTKTKFSTITRKLKDKKYQFSFGLLLIIGTKYAQGSSWVKDVTQIVMVVGLA